MKRAGADHPARRRQLEQTALSWPPQQFEKVLTPQMIPGDVSRPRGSVSSGHELTEGNPANRVAPRRKQALYAVFADEVSRADRDEVAA